MIALNYIPTELEIEMHAAAFFASNSDLKASFIQGVHHTIYYSKTPKKENE